VGRVQRVAGVGDRRGAGAGPFVALPEPLEVLFLAGAERGYLEIRKAMLLKDFEASQVSVKDPAAANDS